VIIGRGGNRDVLRLRSTGHLVQIGPTMIRAAAAFVKPPGAHRPPRRLGALLVAAAISLSLLGVDRPGPAGKGDTLLPNGWRIAPAGRHVMVGDLPLAMLVSPDGRWAIVTNNGYAKPTLTVVELDSLSSPDKTPLADAWLGLAWHPDGRRLFASGGADGMVRELAWRAGKLAAGRTFSVGKAIKEGFL
jgi:hypothetical protein